MKQSDYDLACLIRRQHKQGTHVVYLAARHDLPVKVVEAIVSCRTREGAAKVCKDFLFTEYSNTHGTTQNRT
jgi:uncharacterized protein (DUF2336 family)